MKKIIYAIIILYSVGASSQELNLFRVTADKAIYGTEMKDVLIDLLESGTVVIIDRTTEEVPYLVTTGALFNAPPDKVWGIITDFEKYPEMIKEVKQTRVTRRGNLIDVHYTLGFSIFFFPITIDYTLRYWERENYRMDWRFIKGDLSEGLGFWQLIPLQNNTRTAAFYTTYSAQASNILNIFFRKTSEIIMAFPISTGIVLTEKIAKRLTEGAQNKKEDPGNLLKPVTGLRFVDRFSEKGDVVLIENRIDEDAPVFVNAYSTINAPLRTVWDVITDAPKYTEFMPNVEKISIQPVSENSIRVKYRVNINTRILIKSVDYTLLHTLEPYSRITMDSIDGDVKDIRASWEFIEVTKEKTMVIYRLHSNIKDINFLTRLIFEREPALEPSFLSVTAANIVSAVRERAESVHLNNNPYPK